MGDAGAPQPPAARPSIASQARRQPFAQVMLLFAVTVTVVAVAIIDPAHFTAEFLAGVATVVVLTAVQVAISLSRRFDAGSTPGAWLAIVPLLDIVACTFIRADVIDILPAVGLLVVFPLGWLAFAFPAPLAVAGVLATCFVTSYPLLRTGFDVQSPAAWAQVLALPVMISFFAVTTSSIGRDLTRRQRDAEREAERARAAQRQSEGAELTIRALAETTSDALAVFGLDGRAIVANDAALAIGMRVGRPELTLDGPPAEVYELSGGERIEVDLDIVRRIVAGELRGKNRLLVGPPGDQLVLSITARAVSGPDGEVTGVVLVGHDITELVQAVEVRDRFLDDVGHELKTPLTTILGHAELLALSPDEQVAAQGETISRAAERQLAIVNQLITAGRAVLAEVEPRTAVSPVVEQGVHQARSAAEAKGVSFALVDDLASAAGAGTPVRFPARDLETVVDALASNAVLFTPSGGTVVVGVRRDTDSDAVLVEISDSGVGMSDVELRQAFERFYRTASTRRNAVPGLGLGLSIARTLAEAHGAHLDLTSRPGKGTVATLALPLADIA
ncbi:PAS domain-containing sensor histidine kinase [Herbiconiux moechotypicola]|uniref:histidine kinase n=1 Tax=Herbiconiux moechotypicola TaxID=637393 RepID=A0ABP5Q2V8_9MICO|nr:PAS domain-containing sensor histidine kinase [Herbiconiux moechotypicola]MCS5728214.1 PAS domain-containing sensor histidine kinase [Herbiconiux moechotypicola]